MQIRPAFEQHPVHRSLASVALADPIEHGGHTVTPLVGDDDPACEYLPLDQALAGGEVEITEVSDAGSVPELSVRNRAARPVLIVDGEELIGAKQNRVINLTVLVAAQAETTIPVSCVEAVYSVGGRLRGLELFDRADTFRRLAPQIFAAVGEGEDVRLSGDAAIGAALVAHAKVVHLAAFAEGAA